MAKQPEPKDKQCALVAVVERASREVCIVSGDNAAPRAEVLVRDNGRTAGYVRLTGTNNLAERAVQAVGAQSTQRGWKPTDGEHLSATVVLCTLGSNPLLLSAVKAILAQDHPNFDLVVVDNNPRRGDTGRRLKSISEPRLHIVPEPRRGLSHARNTGVLNAKGEIIVFTDDDAVTDPGWLTALLAVFGADTAGHIGAVTGPAFPAELQYPSQRYFEARGGFPKTLVPTVWTADPRDLRLPSFGRRGVGGPLYPYATARVGAGVNMAFRRSALAKIGAFDTALGAGTTTNGGEDLDAFARILSAGYAIVSTPDAVVHHTHRQDLTGLERQCFGNGTGMAALLTKTVLHHPMAMVVLASRIPKVLRRVAPGSERIAGSDPDVPMNLSKREAFGFVQGPARYVQMKLREQLQRIGVPWR